MRLARRLALLVLALAAVVALPASATADETCTTAVFAFESGWDAPFAEGCAATFLTATPNPADPGELVTLDGSESIGPDGTDADIATYVWDFGDGDTAETLPPESSVTHAYARGRWTATLTIEDALGDPLADPETVEIVVSELPVAAIDAPDGVLRPGVAYQFDAGGSTAPGGTIQHYLWNWGDGSTTQTTGPTTTHTFADDGASRQVTVTVVNDLDLASAPASASIVVDNLDPVVQLVATPSTVDVGEQLTLSAAGSSDPDGSIAQYRWDLDGDGSFEVSTGLTPSVVAGGFPNPGIVVLAVKVVDDSGDFTVKQVVVTVAGSAAGGGDDGSGDGGGSGGGRSGGSGGGTGGSGSGSGGSSFTVGLTGSAIQRLAGALRRGVGLKASANRAATGILKLTVSGRDAKLLRLPGRRGSKPVTIGTLRLTLRADRTAKASIKLTRKAARKLRTARPATLRVTVRGTLAAGAARTTVARIVLLRG